MEHSNVNFRKLFIVVIDDSETVCNILRELLTREGHQVTCFLEPVPAIHSILKTGETPLPDLFFIDLNLPRIDGFEVIKVLKNTLATMHIPIIVISRTDNATIRLQARIAGVNAYVAKPLPPQDILALVRSFAMIPNTTTEK